MLKRCIALILGAILVLTAACGSPKPPDLSQDLRTTLTSADSIWAKGVLPAALPELARFERAPLYRSEAEYDPKTRQLKGSGQIFFTNQTERTLETVYLRTMARIWGPGAPDENFQLHELKVNGQPASFSIGETLITVPLTQPLAPGQTLTISTRVTVWLPEVKAPRSQREAMEWGPVDFSRNAGGYGVGPYLTSFGGFPSLLPGGDEGKEIDAIPPKGFTTNLSYGLYEAFLTLPADWTVVSSGVQIGETKLSGNRKRVHLVAGPSSTGHSIMAGPELKRLSATVGDTTIHAYYHDVPTEDGARHVLKEATAALIGYLHALGPMPLPELDLVPLPIGNGIGGVYTGGGKMILAEPFLRDPSMRRVASMVTQHELAHIWWGEMLIPNRLDGGGWVTEAMAQVATLYVMEQVHGAAQADALRQSWVQAYQGMRGRGLPDAPVNLPIEAYLSPEHMFGIMYNKGALFYDTVRRTVGDELFFDAVRSYQAKNLFQVHSVEGPVSELMAHPEHGEQIAALYQRWILGTYGDEDIR